jgi:archaellum biogenesis ATPase FlaH
MSTDDKVVDVSEYKKRKFKFISIRELAANPKPVDFMMEGLIESGGMNVISGEYGSGKSFLVFSMAFCIASGIDWHGYKVHQAPVLVVAGEGQQGIANRFLALSEHYGVPLPENIHISEIAANFTDIENTREVHHLVQELCPDDGLIIIDTLNKNFGSANENETSAMTQFVHNLDTHFRNFGKTVIVVHHPNKSDPNGSRGSSALPSACEGFFSLHKEKNGQVRFWCTKQKNDRELPQKNKSMFFEISTINFTGANGKSVNSGILVPIDKPIKSGQGHNLTVNDTECVNALSHLVKDDNPKATLVSDDIKKRYGGNARCKGQRMVHQDAWRDECYKRVIVSSDNNKQGAIRQQFNRSRTKLQKHGIIVSFEEYVWFATKSQANEPNEALHL